MMFKKYIFLLCASFVSKIIASVITGQPWHLETHENHEQHIMKPLIELINPLPQFPLIQTPVIASKKIDIPIEQGVKPIYWSTLLPAQTETLSIPESSLRIEQNESNVLKYAIPNLNPNNINYYITYPSDINDGISVAVTPNDRVEKKRKTTVDKSKKVDSEYTSLEVCNKKFQTQTDCNKNIKKRQKILNGEVVVDKNKTFATINHNQEAISDTNNHRPRTNNKNNQIIPNPNQNKMAVKPTETCCQCCTRMCPKTENKIEEKITSFDQSYTADVFNVNLEYADHDCQCIRNSRNNNKFNNKNVRPNEYNIPNNFPLDYLNWIYNLIPNQQLESYFQDINYYFPYNLEALYQLPQSQSKKKNKGSKNKQTKSTEKSPNKRRSNKKSSKNRNDKKKNIDKCNKVVELSPKIMEVENLNDVVSIDAITAKYTSNINVDKDILYYEVPELSPETNIFETNPKIIEINPIIVENIPKIIETIPKIIESNPEIIEILPKIIEENREIIKARPQIIDIVPKVIEINPTNVETCPTTNDIKCGEIKTDKEMSNESNHLNKKNDLALVLNENIDSRREEFLLPLLSDDDFFWDYYPDFTADNGAYITSSEEEEWFNFHNKHFYFNSENSNKEVLKRNLNTNQKNQNIDLTIHSKHRPHANKYSNKTTRTNEEYINKNKNTPKPLDYLDFTTRIVNKEDIPSYIDLLVDKKNKPTCKNNPTHNSYKIQDIETTYAPSRVINYSVAPLYEGLNDSSDEEIRASKLYVQEGDLSIVYSSPFVTEYI